MSTLFCAISGALASDGSLGVWFPGKEVTKGAKCGGLSRVGAVGAGGVQESFCTCPLLCVSALHFLVALCWVRQVALPSFLTSSSRVGIIWPQSPWSQNSRAQGAQVWLAVIWTGGFDLVVCVLGSRHLHKYMCVLILFLPEACYTHLSDKKAEAREDEEACLRPLG